MYPCYKDLWYLSQLNWTPEVKLIWSFMTPHAITATITEKVQRKKVSNTTLTLPDPGFIVFIQLSRLWGQQFNQFNHQIHKSPNYFHTAKENELRGLDRAEPPVPKHGPCAFVYLFVFFSSGDKTRANCLINTAHRITASFSFYCICCRSSSSNWVFLVLMSRPSAQCQGCGDITGPVWGTGRCVFTDWPTAQSWSQKRFTHQT